MNEAEVREAFGLGSRDVYIGVARPWRHGGEGPCFTAGGGYIACYGQDEHGAWHKWIEPDGITASRAAMVQMTQTNDPATGQE